MRVFPQLWYARDYYELGVPCACCGQLVKLVLTRLSNVLFLVCNSTSKELQVVPCRWHHHENACGKGGFWSDDQCYPYDCPIYPVSEDFRASVIRGMMWFLRKYRYVELNLKQQWSRYGITHHDLGDTTDITYSEYRDEKSTYLLQMYYKNGKRRNMLSKCRQQIGIELLLILVIMFPMIWMSNDVVIWYVMGVLGLLGSILVYLWSKMHNWKLNRSHRSQYFR